MNLETVEEEQRGEEHGRAVNPKIFVGQDYKRLNILPARLYDQLFLQDAANGCSCNKRKNSPPARDSFDYLFAYLQFACG